VTVTTGEPGAVVVPRAQAYGEIAPGITRSHDFRLRLRAEWPGRHHVCLNVRMTFAGVLSPTADTFSVPTGQPAAEATEFSYGGPAVAIPDLSTVVRP
jgi:hypothetical protein